MLFIFPGLAISSQICNQNMNWCPFPMRENFNKNTCNFEKIIISNKDVICEDFGKHTKLCNSMYFPREFVVTNFKGMDNKKIIDVFPTQIYNPTRNKKSTKLGDMYYSFECEKEFNNPKLKINIVPNPNIDISPNLISFQLIIMFMVFGFIFALLFGLI